MEDGGSKRQAITTNGEMRKKDKDGVVQVYSTKGYSTTSALSGLRKILGLRKLREGDFLHALRPSRIAARLFGENAIGRSSAVKREMLDGTETTPEPHLDTCVKAFARRLRARAAAPDPP